MNGDERGDSLTFQILTTNGVSRAFGCHHDDIDMLRGFDCLEVDGKSVAEYKRLPRAQVWGDVLLVDRRNA